MAPELQVLKLCSVALVALDSVDEATRTHTVSHRPLHTLLTLVVVRIIDRPCCSTVVQLSTSKAGDRTTPRSLVKSQLPKVHKRTAVTARDDAGRPGWVPAAGTTRDDLGIPRLGPPRAI